MTFRAFAQIGGRALPPAGIAAPLGSDAVASSRRSQPEREQPTFVILGTIEARKNHLMLLDIWTRLVQRWATKRRSC